MIFKSYLLEKDLNLLDNYNQILFYGENIGLKLELKDKLRSNNPKSSNLSLFQEDVIKNKDLLINEILNRSLFENEKIIFIDQANDKILDILIEIKTFIKDIKIFIFAETLEKKSKLRKHFEKTENCAVIPCYKDTEITIKKIIVEKLRNYKGLTTEIVNQLIQVSNLDRNKINNEIKKIENCFIEKEITKPVLEKLLNIKSNDDFDEIKNEALNGNKNKTNKLLAETNFEDEKSIFYLNSLNQRINKLNEIELLKKKGENLDTLISNIRPPIFWKDKPVIIQQLKKWNKNKIKKALDMTYEAEIKIKSTSHLRKDLIIKNLIVNLCCSANSS
jgi:DNA polymerase-3 subunit delta